MELEEYIKNNDIYIFDRELLFVGREKSQIAFMSMSCDTNILKFVYVNGNGDIKRFNIEDEEFKILFDI